jgi:hypothetical protein
MKTYKVTVENTVTGEVIESNSDFIILHVANKLENGLLETHTFNPSDETELDFRLFLSLGRALQDANFGYIHSDVGKMSSKTKIIGRVE